MAVTVSGTSITFNNGTVQSSAGIAAQNCSYTGSLVEMGPVFFQTTNPQTVDLGSGRVMTGLRKAYDGCNGLYIYIRGYNLKNTA